MQKIGKKLLSFLLISLLVISSTINMNNVLAEDGEDSSNGTELDWEVVDNDEERIKEKLNQVEFNNDETARKGKVRVSIVLNEKSTIDNGFNGKDISLDPSAISYRESLKTNQDAIANKISQEVLGGEKLDVVWNLTLAANIISANVDYDKIAQIRDVEGVKDVVIENQYSPDLYSVDEDDPNMSNASGMTSAQYAWAAGYTGAGSKVAIVDTGLDVEHISFDPMAFDIAITEIRNSGQDVELLEKKDVVHDWPFLNASQMVSAEAANAYFNSKVPYGFNYVDGDFDISHANDTEGEHGSHVASIATANKYIYHKNEDGSISFRNALTDVYTQGNAPDAQVLVMKVFGKGGGAYDSDYFAAIEDAIVLGADAVNLSLGSSSAGFSLNTTYQGIIDSLVDCDIVWANSAGNNSYWASSSAAGMLYADGSNFATGGSPATYASTLSTASVDNIGSTGKYLEYDGKLIFYSESSGYGNSPISTIAGEHEFVYVNGFGTEEDFAKVKDELAGKIALCSRGSTSFFQKANAAIDNGAIATIIVNNQPGTIGLNLTGYTHTEPCISITLADGQMIQESATLNEIDGLEYWTGTMVVSDVIGTSVSEDDYYTMSNFSSFGVPGSLDMKPEITAPGGNIYAANGYHLDDNRNPAGGHEEYENMSGTSMASPQMAGIVGVMGEFVRENNLDEAVTKLGITRRALIQSILMATATPLKENRGEYGVGYYSVLNQGSGLANVEAAVNSSVVILMDNTKVNGVNRKDISEDARDGKVKAELGDDPDRSGKYTIEFTVNNITDKDLYYSLGGDFFTQDIYEDGGIEYLDTCTADLLANIVWYVDGIRVESGHVYDFNDDQDGIFDNKDAQAILDYVVGVRETIGDYEYADLDGDGSITTYDAYLALKLANYGEVVVPANGNIKVRAEVSIDKEQMSEYDNNGNYIEGYLYVNELDSKDGAIGISNSIPVLGYYGSWGEVNITDVGSYLEYGYGLEERDPYLATATALGERAYKNEAFIAYHPELNVKYAIGGNPLSAQLDDGYYPERNAINGNSTLVGAQYSLVRNISANKYELVDEENNVISEKENIGNTYAAYYYPAQGTWQATSTSSKFGYKPTELAEGDRVTLRMYGAPEYYVDENGVNWNNINPSMEIPFVIDNTAPRIDSVFGKRVEVEEEVVNEETGETEIVTGSNVLVTVSAVDNEYIAAMIVYDDVSESEFAVLGSRSGEKKSANDYEDFAVVIDDEQPSDHLLIEVWDYAANVTTIKVNLNKEELDEEVSIVINREKANTVVGGAVKLEATVYPWGISEQGVTWSSSDENVATVNNGVVTGTGVGLATITATAVADPSKTVTCEINVISIDKDYNAVIWNEEGQIWPATFNSSQLPNYTKSIDTPLRLPIASLTYNSDGKLYGATLNSDNIDSTVIYELDPETFEAREVGAPGIGIMDFAPAVLNENMLIGVYAYYVVILDAQTGELIGALNMSSRTGGAWLVGITYEEQFNGADYYWLVDETGAVYQMPMRAGRYYYASKITDLGYSTDVYYYNSLYWDGDSLVWAKFSEESNKVDLIYWNEPYTDGSIYNLGSFDDGVWPVGGLYNDYIIDTVVSEGHKDIEDFEECELLSEVEMMSRPSSAVKGSTNSISNYVRKAGPNRSTSDVSENENGKTVTITITAEEAKLNNGLYVVEYDSSLLTLVSVNSNEQFNAINKNTDGKVIFGFINLDGVDKDTVLATLTFTKDNNEETTITVNSEEMNNDFTGNKEEFVIDGKVLAETLTVEPETLTLEPKEEYQLSVTVLPENTANKEVTYESSDPSVVTVDENGVVTAVANGIATITVKTTDGSNLSATCTVTVKDPTVLATSLTVNPTSLTIETGKSATVTATVLPEDTTNREVTYESSDPSVVTVDGNGKVTGVKAGKAVVTVKTTDGSNLSATCTVTVNDPVIKATSVTVTPTSLTLEKGRSANLTATVMPANTTNKKVTYTSSDPSVATVDANGKVTAKKAGTVTITVKTTDGSNKTATVKVNVIVKITSIKANPMNMTLEVGKTGKFTPVVSPSDATNKKLTYKSSNTAIATVDANGKITAKKAGKVTITATTNDGSKLTATCTVTVVVKAASVKLNYTSVNIVKGNTLTVKATVAPSNTTNKKVTWKSSNTAVAIVDANGKITAKKAGTATITCTTADGSNKKATIKVTVKNPVKATSVKLDKTSLSLKVGKSATVKATVGPTSTTNKKVTFKSSNTAVATVDANGKITAKKAGTVTITCTTADGSNKKATVKVTVTK